MSGRSPTSDPLLRWLPWLIAIAALVGIWIGITVFAGLT